jgi:hypothetical protein
MPVEPFLLSPLFTELILPFVLVFTLIFAILQKSNLLGEGKKQIDALIGLVVGLMLIAFPGPRNVIVLLMPFLAVSAVILLVFMLLYGFVVGKKDGDVLGKAWKVAFGTILTVALISYIVFIMGYWDFIWNLIFGRGGGTQIGVNLLLLIVIAGAIIAVVKGGGSSGSSS